MRRTTSAVAVTAMAGAILALSMPAANAADIPLPTNDFAGLRAAVSTANGTPEPDTITLNGATTYTLDGAAGENANASGDLDVTAPLTIVGNGATIDGAGLDRLFDVLAVGSLTLTNVNITDGTAPAAENGGAIRAAGGTTVTVTGGEIADSTAINAGAVAATAGSGGAIVAAGVLDVTGTALNGNAVSRGGGAIEVTATGSATLTDVTADSNSAVAASGPGNGGVLHISGAGSATVNGGSFTNNSAVEGGALWNSPAGVLTVSEADFASNTATGALADQGGGAIFTEGGTVTISGGVISENAATGAAGSGGAIQNINGTVTISGTTISDNTAMRAGGGIEAGPILGSVPPAPPTAPARATATTLDSVTLQGNSLLGAPRNGGGLHLTGAGTVDVIDSIVTGNTSAEGGGLWNSAVGTMTVANSDISSNTADGVLADQGGGGIFTEGGPLTVTGGSITENEATGAAGSGGGIQNINGTLTAIGTLIADNTALRAGGGIEAGPILASVAPAPPTAPARATATTLDSVTLQGNSLLGAPRNGGGLHLTGVGTVAVTGSAVSGNTAAEGGGLWNSALGIMTVTDTTIENNTADGPLADQGGGGIFTEGGPVTVTSSSIATNVATGLAGSGGGILNIRGNVTVTNSALFDNSAVRAGGGIEAGPILLDGAPDPASPATSTTLTGVVLSGNSVSGPPGNGGGLHITGAGTVNVDTSVVSENTAQEGGGLWDSAAATTTVTNSTISGNTALAVQSGGGLYNDGGTLSATNVTITDNVSDLGGGVFSADGSSTTLLHATIVGNSTGIGGPATITNSIVAANTGDNVEAGAAIVSGGGNVLGVGVTSTNPADVVGVANPGLGALGDNGGPTPTMLPQPNSPAIDFGLNAASTPADQRGVARPLDGNFDGTLRVDSGAVEAPGAAPLPTAPPARPAPVQPNYTG